MASIILEAILFYLYYFPQTKLLSGDESRYFTQAINVLQGGEWQDHLFWPPLQSLVIAAFFKLFGTQLLPLQLFQYLLILISAILVRDITYRETHNQVSAEISFALFLLLPSWLAYSQFLWPEALHVFLFVTILWINHYKLPNWKWALISGLLLAWALLTKSLLLLFVPFLFWPLWVKIFKNQQVQRNLLSIGLQIIMMIVVMTPFAINSKKNFGSWMVSNSSMFNLNVGLNDQSRQNFIKPIAGKKFNEYMKSADSFEERERLLKQKIMNQINQQGLIELLSLQLQKQYFRLFDYKTFFTAQFQGSRDQGQLSRYSHHVQAPLPQSLLALDRIVYSLGLFALFSVLLIKGMSSVFHQQMLLFVIYNLGLFLLLHAKTRFRVPLVPLFAIYAGYFYYLVKTETNLKKRSYKAILALVAIFTLIITSSSQFLDNNYPL